MTSVDEEKGLLARDGKITEKGQTEGDYYGINLCLNYIHIYKYNMLIFT